MQSQKATANPKKKCNTKIELVRNAEKRVTKPVVISCSKEQLKRKVEQQLLNKYDVKVVTERQSKVPKAVLNVAELNSALKVATEIQKTNKAKPSKLSSFTQLRKKESEKAREKVLQKLNFPLDEKLYEGLVKLDISSREIAASAATTKPNIYRPRLTRDPVPSLEDVYNIIGQEPQTRNPIMPKIVLPKPEQIVFRYCDNTYLDRQMDSWKMARPERTLPIYSHRMLDEEKNRKDSHYAENQDENTDTDTE